MKKLSLIFNLILVFQFTLLAQSGWNNVTLSGNYPGLLGVYAVDSDNIWVVGQEGTILNTTDNGTSWNEISCPVTSSLRDVHFINADTGWVGYDDDFATKVMRTTDRGSSWEFQTISTNPKSMFDIEFIEGSPGEPPRGYVTAGLALVWMTDDYGENWEAVNFGGCGAADFQSICFINKNEGWFVGEPSVTQEVTIVHTTDGGQNYEIQDNPYDPDIKLNCVCFADDQHGIAVGLDGTMLYTSDGGQNWEIRSYNSNLWQSVFLTQSGKAWAVGANGNIAYSTDWGYTWTVQQSGVTCILWEVFFINDDEGWIVGGGIGQPGVILHTTTGGVITGVDEKDLAAEFELHQNYPNPFNPNTTIKWQMPKRGFVTLKIYDVLGCEVTTLVNEEFSAGKYETLFNASRFSSGIYFYQIKAGIFVQTRKMILLK